MAPVPDCTVLAVVNAPLLAILIEPLPLADSEPVVSAWPFLNARLPDKAMPVKVDTILLAGDKSMPPREVDVNVATVIGALDDCVTVPQPPLVVQPENRPSVPICGKLSGASTFRL